MKSVPFIENMAWYSNPIVDHRTDLYFLVAKPIRLVWPLLILNSQLNKVKTPNKTEL